MAGGDLGGGDAGGFEDDVWLIAVRVLLGGDEVLDGAAGDEGGDGVSEDADHVAVWHNFRREEADGDALSVGGLEVGEQVDGIGRALIIGGEGEGRGADREGGGGAGFGDAADDFDEGAGGIRRRGDVEQAPDAFVSEVGVDASDGLAGRGSGVTVPHGGFCASGARGEG